MLLKMREFAEHSRCAPFHSRRINEWRYSSMPARVSISAIAMRSIRSAVASCGAMPAAIASGKFFHFTIAVNEIFSMAILNGISQVPPLSTRIFINRHVFFLGRFSCRVSADMADEIRRAMWQCRCSGKAHSRKFPCFLRKLMVCRIGDNAALNGAL
jgi:hypothetical protein